MRTKNPHTLASLTPGLAAVAARLEPEEAAAVCGRAAAILTRAASTISLPDLARPVVDALSLVAARR
jgi:hypothetical protein